MKKKFLILLIVCLLGISNFTYGMNGKHRAEAATASSISASISLTSKSYAEIKDAVLLPEGKNQRIVFSLSWMNKEAEILDVNDYILTLFDQTNTTYALKTVQPVSKRISANAVQTYEYYAEVPATATLSNLKLKILTWDFSVKGYKRNLGQITLSQAAFPIAKQGNQAEANYSQTSYGYQVTALHINNKEDKQEVELNIEIVNKGKRTEVLPDYEYELRTSSGYRFPLLLTMDDSSITSLTPKEVVKATLTGDISKNEPLKGAELWVNTKLMDAAQKQFTMPVAIMVVPSATRAEEAISSATFSNSDGRFQTAVSELQRLPWEDQDIISAELSLKNLSSEAVPLPVLSGYFLLDNALEVEAQFIKLDQVIGLQPNQVIRYQLLGKIPYTNEFKNVKLYLNESINAGSKKERARITIKNTSESIKRIMKNESYSYRDLGRSLSYKITSSNVYEGKADKMFVVELMMENSGMRNTILDQLTGHYEHEDGTIYPAVFMIPDLSISPGSNAIVTISSVLPNRVDTEKLNLVIGQAVTGSALTRSGEQPDGYIRGVNFELPEEDKKVKLLDQPVQMRSYEIEFLKISRPYIYYTEMDLNIEYKLSKDGSEKKGAAESKLLISLEDASGRELFTEVYGFEEGNSESLILGTHTIKVQKTLPQNITIQSSKYTLKIYNQFVDGYKKLIASTEIEM